MAASLGEAVLNLRGDDKQLQDDVKGAKSKVADAMEGIGSALEQTGMKMSAAITLPVVGLGAAAVNAAGNYEAAVSQVDAVFKGAGEAVVRFTEGSAERLAMSETKALEAANTYGNLFQTMGMGTEESKDLSLSMVQLTADLASFYDARPEDMMAKLRSGITGETEPLKQLGVMLNQNAIAAKAMEMGLVELTPDMSKVKGATNSLGEAQELLKKSLEEAAPATEGQKEALSAMQKAYEDVELAINEAGEGSSEHLQAVSMLQSQYEEYEDVLGTGVGQVMGYVTAESDNLRSALMGEAGELDSAAKAQATYALIMEQTTNAQGDLARTSQEWGNQVRIARAQLVNTSKSLGLLLLPYAKQAIYYVNDLMKKFKGLSDENKKTIVIVAAVAAAVGPLLIVLGTLVSSIGAIIGAFSSVVAVVGGPVLAIIAAVILAVALLALAWKNDWLGMRTTLTKLWNDTLKPIFQQVMAWLKVHIPAAIATLKHFWLTVLKPAIEIIWGFVKDHLLPLMMALGEFLGVSLKLTLTILAGIWQNVLQPALEKVWKFISDKLQPIFEKLHDFWENTLRPAIEKVGFLDVLATTFDRIGEAIQGVIGFISNLTTKLKKINLPDWMTPGSPTPWEIGLRGVSDAMKEVAGVQANLEMGLSGLSPATVPVPGGGGVGSAASVMSSENHYHIGVLVADERGLQELERRLRPIRNVENQRRGTE